MRLFIALHLQPATLEPVQALQRRLREADLRREVRWVEPSGMHLTLKFLGETEPGRSAAVREALGSTLPGFEAARLSPGAVGGFPNLRRPRVLWVGLREEGAALQPLVAAIESAMERLGWERERRPFQPHLTLGRRKEMARGGSGSLAPELTRALESAAPLEAPMLAQPHVALMQSHLGPAGARYEELEGWTLGA